MKSRAWIGWTIVIFMVLAALALAKVGTSQEKKSYELTENQRLRLEVQQGKFALAQEHYQQAIAAFNSEVEAIEKENGWAKDSVQFDPNSLTFREIPKPPAPPAKEPEKPPTKNP